MRVQVAPKDYTILAESFYVFSHYEDRSMVKPRLADIGGQGGWRRSNSCF